MTQPDPMGGGQTSAGQTNPVPDDFHFDTRTDLRPDQKAEVLIQALPWLQKFSGALVVVKYGGNAMIDDELKRAFAEDMVFLRQVGLKPVVVHGGGPQISSMLDRLGIESEFRGGLRVTTPEAMDVVRMVLTGQVSRELVGLLNAHGPHAVGLSGEDGGLFQARRRHAYVDGEPVDVGLVGDVVKVNPGAVQDLLDAGRIPVVSTVAPDMDDPTQVLNVNADTFAGAVAGALKAKRLLLLTDVPGVLDKSKKLIPELSVKDARKLIADGTISGGMIPKVETCIYALEQGVQGVVIIDGKTQHAVLLELFTNQGTGTLIHK